MNLTLMMDILLLNNDDKFNQPSIIIFNSLLFCEFVGFAFSLTNSFLQTLVSNTIVTIQILGRQLLGFSSISKSRNCGKSLLS